MAISELKEVQIYLNCKNMLKYHVKVVNSSKFCKKCEKKCDYESGKMLVRFHMDFNGDGNIEIYDKLIYDWKLDYLDNCFNGYSYNNKNIECERCGGSGYINVYDHIENGICFACGGTGAIKVGY